MDIKVGDLCQVRMAALHEDTPVEFWNTVMYLGLDRTGKFFCVKYIPSDLSEVIPLGQNRLRKFRTE